MERGYDVVTVQDIVDRANLSRATFYLHYREKDELLFSGLTRMFDEQATLVAEAMPRAITGEGEAPSLVVFRHAAHHRALYRAMLRSQHAGIVADGVRRYIARQVLINVQAFIPPEKLPVPANILAQHYASSLVGILMWWLEDERGHGYPPDVIAQQFQKLNAVTHIDLADGRKGVIF